MVTEAPHRAGTGTDTRALAVAPRVLLVKALVLVAMAVAGAALARHMGLRQWIGPGSPWALGLRRFGWGAAPLFTLVATVLIGLGVPRLALCPLAGAAFGFWGGLATSTLATMAAYFAAFLFIRGRHPDARPLRELPRSMEFLRHDPGVAGVILVRLIPVPGLIGTTALSLSPVRTLPFLWGSLVGLLPEAAPFILVGAGLLESDWRHLGWLAAAVVGMVAGAWLLLRQLLKRGTVPDQDPR